MANYDKYDPKAGGFRAALAANYSVDDIKSVVGVGLDASGNVVKGEGASGMVGVLVLTEALKAGDIVDVMTNGEIVAFGTKGKAGGGTEAFSSTAGTAYYAHPTTGVVSTTSTTGQYRIGHTVKKDRLVVRFESTPVPAP